MRRIDGHSRSVNELLKARKYAIDSFQREYKWQAKQLTELLNDLTSKFLEYYSPDHPREAVESYGDYFLGSIIVSQKDGKSYIVDGQQRLTTLTLLLIFLHNLQGDRPDRVKLEDLIFSEKYGTKSFNLAVDDRTPTMEALFNNLEFDAIAKPESIKNIVGRYEDIERQFSLAKDAEDEDSADSAAASAYTHKALPYFVDWLIENVHLVEITAPSDEDAYTIFETMNDRGLSLTPLEMLKGYVLANVTDETKKKAVDAAWKAQIAALNEIGKEEDADAFKAWLRSQYARTIRDRKKGASPGDWDRLGTEFHRWIRDHAERIGLHGSMAFFNFINRDADFYLRQYRRLRQASLEYTPGLETVYYLGQFEFNLQFPVLLSVLKPGDDPAEVDRKLRIVGDYLDIHLVRRLWNFRLIAYNRMQYSMFAVMRDIRGKSAPELVTHLKARLAEEDEAFATNDRLRMHKQNAWPIHQILARLTEYLEVQAGMESRFREYVNAGATRYEVEHIWSAHPERHKEEFQQESDFWEYRSRVGGLLLLPKQFNASYGAKTYGEKLPHYFGQNLLAKSLNAKSYEHNPGFLDFKVRSGLALQAHAEFKKADLDKRQDLYRRIAELVWDPERLANHLG